MHVVLVRTFCVTAAVATFLLAVAGPGAAQVNPNDPFRLGIEPLVQGLNANLRDALVIRIEQVLRSLPPGTPQLPAFTFDFAMATWVASDLPGTTAFFSPNGLPPGQFSLKVSASYFSLRQLERSVDYRVTATAKFPFQARPDVFVDNQIMRFGVEARAQVGALTFAGSYGLAPWAELDLLVPVVITDAHARASLSATPVASMPPSTFGDIFFADSSRQLANALADGAATMGQLPIGDPALSGSAEVGLGRIGVAAKFRLLESERWSLAANTEFLLPSPNQAELAGSDTGAFFPRLIASYEAAEAVRAYANIGYDLDFSENTLRSFVWQAGGSYATERLSLDLGLSGSVYNEGVEIFVPTSTASSDDNGTILDASSTALNPQRLDTDFVDVVFGLQVPITETFSVSGVATIPVVNVEFRPYAVGTVSATYRF